MKETFFIIGVDKTDAGYQIPDTGCRDTGIWYPVSGIFSYVIILLSHISLP
jgi:hypothetical protein